MEEYNESDELVGSGLESEYDSVFTGEEKADMLLKLTSDKFSRRPERIKIKQIGFTEPLKRGRKKTMTGLTATVKDIGVVSPVHVMLTEESDLDCDEDDNFKYIMIDGVRRVFAAMKNGIEEIDAIVWDFEDKEQGMDLALVLSLVLNRTQRREWSEIWDLYQILEMQTSITPGTLEYLLQLNGGDAMKLKDVMLCDYEEPKEMLLNNEKDLEGCYKLLQKLRKEEDQLAKEDATGFSDTVEGAEDVVSDNTETEDGGQLSDQDVMELLEMVDSIDDLDEVSEEDFDTLNSGVSDSQAGGERHPLDPALKSAVLSRDDFKCKCCGFGGAAALGVLAVHHILPVHTFSKGQATDYMDNLTTLCLNHHILLHVAERNGGKLHMTKEEFETYSEEEQTALKKCLSLAKIAVEADKRKNMSLDDIRKATTDSIRHPMPGTGLKENQIAYSVSKGSAQDRSNSSESGDSDAEEQ